MYNLFYYYLGVPLANARVGLLRASLSLRQSPRFARGSAGFAALRIPHAFFIHFLKTLHYSFLTFTTNSPRLLRRGLGVRLFSFSLFTFHSSLFTLHFSLFTFHSSLFTSFYLFPNKFCLSFFKKCIYTFPIIIRY